MCIAPAPARLKNLATVSGRYWSDVEVEQAFRWIFDGSNLRCLVLCAAHALDSVLHGTRSTGQLAMDAEDACQDFAMRRFRRVVRRYDPARGSFEGFLLFCFRRWCRARGRVLLRQAIRMEWFNEPATHSVALSSTMESPEASLSRSEARRDLRRVVAAALATLKKSDRTILRLQYWDGATIAACADAIGSTPGATRTRASRARDRLAPQLRAAAAAFGFGGAK